MMEPRHLVVTIFLNNYYILPHTVGNIMTLKFELKQNVTGFAETITSQTAQQMLWYRPPVAVPTVHCTEQTAKLPEL